MQVSSRPELQALVQSVELGGTGRSVALSFSVSAEALDAMMQLGRQPQTTPAPPPR